MRQTLAKEKPSQKLNRWRIRGTGETFILGCSNSGFMSCFLFYEPWGCIHGENLVMN